MSARTKRSLALLALLLLAPLLACDSRGSGLTAIVAPAPPALSGLTLTAGALTPTFNGNTTAYSATVSNATTSIQVIPTASRAGTTILVNGAAVASGTTSPPIALVVGTNNITVEVENTNGVGQRTYTIAVRRSG